ncbi:MAG: CoA transferase [bacterium]|nr:CoA transferase [bacterium]
MAENDLPGALAGIRVVELAGEASAYAGLLLAGMGAEVIVVEPPGGHRTRGFEPFLDDEPGPECSLWWWHYNASKLGVTLDLDGEVDRDRFRSLVGTADVVLESERPGRLADLGIDHDGLRADRPELIWVSLTPFGRDGPRSEEESTDLTVLAAGGPVWSCGYDDHAIAPQRGGGNQGYQTGSVFAVLSAQTALLARDRTGRGQFVDVSLHAAANVTTEFASVQWLVAGEEVQRQTGRHAAVEPTTFTRALSADGIDVNTGFPPRSAREFSVVVEWMESLGLKDRFEEFFFLEMGARLEEDLHLSQVGQDPEVTAMFGAAREAVRFIAQNVTAYEFFTGAQERGLAVGIIYSPEEVLADPHFIERGFPVEVEHEDLGRSFTYAGAPYIAPKSPYRVRRRAPRIGEHNPILEALA